MGDSLGESSAVLSGMAQPVSGSDIAEIGASSGTSSKA